MRTSIGALLLLCSLQAVAGITPEEFARRRFAVVAQLDSSSALVMRASDIRMRANDVNYRYRQESNFWYLTGVEEPNGYLIISPGGIAVGEHRGVVAIFPELAAPENGEDDGVIPAGQMEFPVERFSEALRSVASKVKTLYVSAPDIRFVNDWLNGKSVFLDRDIRKAFEQSYPGVKVKNASALLARARGVKSAAEVEQIRRAAAITGDGLSRAMRICAPGIFEYELQAEIEYEMTRQGSAGPAFPSIVGSGLNTLNYHYELNNRQAKAGELVVMDVGAEYGGYSADVTRTIPISGRFTKEQAEVYDLVLKAQEAAIAGIRPGAPFRVVDTKAREVVEAAGFGKYWGHGASHHLGVDTHDAGMMDTLRAGMVVTVEPGLYIPATDTTRAEAYRGWGVRIEDDVLVTDNGCEVLSGGIPKQRKEIEAIVGKSAASQPK
jgi:Xaa-Pro aminopeptidase